MDVININNGQFKVDDIGNIFVNNAIIYDRWMIDNKISTMTSDMRSNNATTMVKVQILEDQLRKSNEVIDALIHILCESSLIVDKEDVDKTIQEIKDSKKVLDTLVEVGKQNDKK